MRLPSVILFITLFIALSQATGASQAASADTAEENELSLKRLFDLELTAALKPAETMNNRYWNAERNTADRRRFIPEIADQDSNPRFR
jgi:hypothetical protein